MLPSHQASVITFQLSHPPQTVGNPNWWVKVLLSLVVQRQVGLLWLNASQQPGSYRGSEMKMMMMMKCQFHSWRKPEYLEETTEPWQVTDQTFTHTAHAQSEYGTGRQRLNPVSYQGPPNEVANSSWFTSTDNRSEKGRTRLWFFCSRYTWNHSLSLNSNKFM